MFFPYTTAIYTAIYHVPEVLYNSGARDRHSGSILCILTLDTAVRREYSYERVVRVGRMMYRMSDCVWRHSFPARLFICRPTRYSAESKIQKSEDDSYLFLSSCFFFFFHTNPVFPLFLSATDCSYVLRVRVRVVYSYSYTYEHEYIQSTEKRYERTRSTLSSKSRYIYIR